MKKSSFTYLLTAICAALAISACARLDFGGMIWAKSDVVDKRFEQSMAINAQTSADGPICTIDVASNEYRIYAFGDSHVHTGTKNLDIFVKDYLADANAAPFAISVGDLIDATGHWDMFHEHIKPLLSGEKRIFMTDGNHDLYFGQWKDYKEHFGSPIYYFEVQTPSEGKDLYISLDSASGTLGIKQRKWLGNLLESSRSKYRNVIVYTHTHFFMRDYSQGITDNFAIEETQDLLNLFGNHNVTMVISGHDHTREETPFRGVLYSTMDAISDDCKNASYCVYHIRKHEATISYVEL